MTLRALPDLSLPDLRLEQLGPPHAAELLAGQDEALAREIIGRRWDPATLEEFLARSARWREDGPLREFAAIEQETGRLLGGGGLNTLTPGLERGQAMLTYWVLRAERGRGVGRQLATALVDRALADGRLWELVLLIAEENAGSRALASSLGATPTGEWQRHPTGGDRRAERWMLPLGGARRE